MIPMTRLDGSSFFVNLDLIERIEPTPDTIVALVTGERLVVRESPTDLVDRIVAFKQRIRGEISTTGSGS